MCWVKTTAILSPRYYYSENISHDAPDQKIVYDENTKKYMKEKEKGF